MRWKNNEFIISQARLQQYVNQELSDLQAGFRKGRGIRDQIANIHQIIEKAREFQKNILFFFIDYTKAFDCVDRNKLWEKSSKDGNTRPSYLPPKKPVCRSKSNSYNQTWNNNFKIGKGALQGCILSPCLVNLHAEYIMRNAGLEEAQAGIKIAGKNSNNLRQANDTTLMAESEEELKSLLMKVKEESQKVGLKLNFQKTKTMASSVITSQQIGGETVETVADFVLGGSKITADGDCSHKIKRCFLLGRKALTNLDGILKQERHHFPDKGLNPQSYGFSSSHVWM